jgi:hypothetical protein
MFLHFRPFADWHSLGCHADERREHQEYGHATFELKPPACIRAVGHGSAQQGTVLDTFLQVPKPLPA